MSRYENREHAQRQFVGSLGRSLSLVVVLASMFFPLTAAAQGKDDLFEVTMKMDMAGMPMAMPAQTNRVCAAKNRKDEDYIPKEPGCKMTESNRSGNKLTYKMACEGKNAMTIAGELTYAADKYDGKQRMTGTMEGTPVDMTQTFSGKRVGDCTAK